DRGIAGRSHRAKNVRVHGRYFLADKSRPSEITVDRSRPIQFAPEIDEYEIAGPNDAVGTGTRFVMRVAAVWAHGTNGRIDGHQAMPSEVVEDALLDSG